MLDDRQVWKLEVRDDRRRRQLHQLAIIAAFFLNAYRDFATTIDVTSLVDGLAVADVVATMRNIAKDNLK